MKKMLWLFAGIGALAFLSGCATSGYASYDYGWYAPHYYWSPPAYYGPPRVYYYPPCW